jgi:hypothetical protein
MRYHIDGTDASFHRVGGGHGESLRGIWASGSAFHNLAVSLARIAVWFCRNGYRAEICRQWSRREQTSWRYRLLQRELESSRGIYLCERRAESGERRAESGERTLESGNFGRSSAYFRGIRYSLNSIFGRYPIPVDIISKNCSRNQWIL